MVGPRHIYETQLLPLVPILIETHNIGLATNQARIGELIQLYRARQRYAVELAHAACGYPVNLASNPQLACYLYDELGLPVQVDKDTKKPSIGADAVAILRNLVGPVVDPDEPTTVEYIQRRLQDGADALLEARTLYAESSQLLSHYLVPLEGVEIIRPNHPLPAQASGRWSTTEPPWQQ